MDRETVNSSMIVSVGFDTNLSILEIEFKSDGAVWQYFDFPESKYHDFRNAGSLGRFFHTNIKGQHPESRVG